MDRLFQTEATSPRGAMVGLTLPGGSVEATHEHLEELQALAATRGLTILHTFTQRLEKPHGATRIGAGKVEEVEVFVRENKLDIVLFDDELSPRQVKTLEEKWQCQVWDRSFLILEIFAMHARTAQAKTQVKLAQYQYLLPRLTGMWGHLAHQKGGRGMKGPGETELETDKRLIQKKICVLQEKLHIIEQQSAIQRQERKQYVKVALVGYTNAGKSTLMQSLSKAKVVIEDKLFATLSTTVRKVVLGGTPFLLADTVGFIRKLPHTLIECFKSTLAEVCEADLLLHVVDFSNPYFEAHIQLVQEMLEEIGASHIPVILVFNKIDRLPLSRAAALEGRDEEGVETSLAEAQTQYAARYGCPVVLCSGLQKQSTTALRLELERQVLERRQKIYPFSEKDAAAPVF